MHCLRLIATVWAIICALWGPSSVRCAVSSVTEQEGEPCQFPDEVAGRCEELSECVSTGGVARRNGSVALCSSSSALVIHVCCRRPHLIAQEMCNVWMTYWSATPRILNRYCHFMGVEVNRGEFPNMVSLGHREDGDVQWTCSGSLITPLFVLTAARCVSSKPLVVKLGEFDRSSSSVENTQTLNGGLPQGIAGEDSMRSGTANWVSTEQVIDVAETFVYPEYQRPYHDIALLKLERPASLTLRVLPACLSTSAFQGFTRGSRFVVAGWGRTEANRSGSNKPMKVNINYIESSKCSQLFKNSATNLSWGITSDLICAGKQNASSCPGESGGPLMQETDLQAMPKSRCKPRVVAGVLSFGPPCGQFRAYTRVASYLDWITAIVAPGAHPNPGAK